MIKIVSLADGRGYEISLFLLVPIIRLGKRYKFNNMKITSFELPTHFKCQDSRNSNTTELCILGFGLQLKVTLERNNE